MMNIGRRIQDFRKSKLLKGSAVFFAMKIGAMFIGYVNIWIISRFFGAEALGLFSFVLAVVTLFVVFAKAGTGMATIKFVAKFLAQKKYGKIFSYYKQTTKIILPGSLLGALVMFFFNNEIAHYVFDKPHYAYYLKIAAFMILPVSFTQVNAQFHRAFNKIVHFAFFNLYTTSLTLAVLLGFILLGYGRKPMIPISVHAISAIIMMLLSFFSLGVLLYRYRKSPKDFVSLKNITKVSFPMYHITIAAAAVNWIDKLLLGAFVSDAQMGIYHGMHRVSVLLTLFLISANAVLGPKFSELWEKNKMQEIRHLVRRSTRLLTLLVLPPFLLMLFFSEEIALFFNQEFTKGANVLLILAVGQFINVWSGPVGLFLLMSGHERFNRKISLVTTVFFIAAAYVGIRYWGIIGAASAVSLVYILRNFFYVFYVNKKFGMNFLYIPFLNR